MGHSVYQLIDAMQAATRTEDVDAEFMQFIGDRGFSYYMCGELKGGPNRRTRPMLFGNWPDKWRNHYDEHGYLLKDPTIARVLRSTEPFSYAEVTDQSGLPRVAREFMEEAKEFGLGIGFAIPIHGNGTYVAAFSIAGDRGDLSANSRADLHLAAIYCHACLRGQWKKKMGYHDEAVPMLTERQRECLGWAAAGKTDWEIAKLLSLSEHTVHRHIEEAKRRYGVTTRIQAVVNAMEVNEFQYWPE